MKLISSIIKYYDEVGFLRNSFYVENQKHYYVDNQFWGAPMRTLNNLIVECRSCIVYCETS